MNLRNVKKNHNEKNVEYKKSVKNKIFSNINNIVSYKYLTVETLQKCFRFSINYNVSLEVSLSMPKFISNLFDNKLVKMVS